MDYQNQILQKIHNSPETIARQLAYWQFKGKKVAFTNGCFDILHLGHVQYLSQAASLCDVMIVGLNTDDSTRRLKGEKRPINPQHARAFLLASLRFVDAVVLFDDDTPYELIKFIQPDFLIKGDEYKPNDIVGYDIVTKKGGKVITISMVEGYSTTSIVTKLQ